MRAEPGEGGTGGTAGGVASGATVAAIRPSTWLTAALARVASTAIGSLSIASQVAAGQRSAAAIDRMPEPQPTSSTRSGCAPRSASACSSSSTSRVLAWVPVPNAMPGSSAIGTSSGPGVNVSQLGTTTNWRVNRLTRK